VAQVRIESAHALDHCHELLQRRSCAGIWWRQCCVILGAGSPSGRMLCKAPALQELVSRSLLGRSGCRYRKRRPACYSTSPNSAVLLSGLKLHATASLRTMGASAADEVVQDIHKTKTKLVMYVTGGGSMVRNAACTSLHSPSLQNHASCTLPVMQHNSQGAAHSPFITSMTVLLCKHTDDATECARAASARVAVTVTRRRRR
jgi:hypothetical protein